MALLWSWASHLVKYSSCTYVLYAVGSDDISESIVVISREEGLEQKEETTPINEQLIPSRSAIAIRDTLRLPIACMLCIGSAGFGSAIASCSKACVL